jgi:hypothetical protein
MIIRELDEVVPNDPSRPRIKKVLDFAKELPRNLESTELNNLYSIQDRLDLNVIHVDRRP